MLRLFKYSVLLVVAWALVSCSEPSASTTDYQAVVRQAIEIMDSHGLYAEGNVWTIYRSDALGVQDPSEEKAKDLILRALRVAGGRHSSLLAQDEPIPGTGDQKAMPTVTAAENGVWIVTLPAFNGSKEQGADYARAVLDALPNQPSGLILDLRQAQGENPYPMLAAVHRFLRSGTVLNIRSRQGLEPITVESILSEVGAIEAGTHVDCPVALLVGPETRGAGEAVMLSFGTSYQVTTIGSRTAGYVAVNQAFPLSDGSRLWLTTGNYVTPSGREYGENPIEAAIQTAKPLEKAKEWLNEVVPNEEYFRRYVGIAVSYMDVDGLLAEGPEWDAARTEALKAKPQSLAEAHTIIRQMLRLAGGKHSQLWTPEQRELIEKNYYGKLPSVERTAEGFIVVNLPGCMGSRDYYLKYARAVLNNLPSQVPGVIIDLRENNGGNMYPMLAAVHRFLPNGTLLTFRSRSGDNVVTTLGVLNYVGIQMSAPFGCPVAILTSQTTASAAEATLLSFRGLVNTRTFGTETGGYSSGNVTYVLDDGSEMLLTTSRDVARTGEVFFEDPIAPDVNTTTPKEDAIKWLLQKV